MKQKTLENNIIIVGAGLVGLSVALSLKNSNGSIQILENHLPEMLTHSKNNSRPISLSYGSVRILTALGVWNELEKFACPILSVHVSEKNRFGFTKFSALEQNVPALGYVVPFSKLQSALYHAVAEQENISIKSIQSIEKINCSDTGAQIEIKTASGKSEMNADLLIATDGTNSTCRRLLKISSEEKNFNEVAQIFQLELSEPHTNTAYERFTKRGVLAVLPLYDKNKAQLVWTKSVGVGVGNKIVEFFQDIFKERLSIKSVKKIAEFPLKTMIAEKQIIQSAVLLGNAAHTIYPVAAQGFNLGLHDVALFSDVLIDAIKNKKNIGDLSVLKNYETLVEEHQKKIFCITDQLTSLFELPLIGGLRGLGLLTIDLIKPFKNTLAKRTMGIAGKLPKLLRGSQ